MLQKERLHNNYDFLRVFAALGITFTHSYNLLLRNNEEWLMSVSHGHADFSSVGLDIFFAVSGYLIAKSAVNASSLKNYLWKRFLRIQPLLIVVTLLSIFLLGPFFTALPAAEYFHSMFTYSYFRNILPFFGVQFYLPEVFRNNIAEPGVNGSLWTLVSEERLYIIMAMIFLFRPFGKKALLFFIAGLNLLYFSHNVIFGERLIAYLNGANVFYALIFLNGAALYLLKVNFKKPAILFFAALALVIAAYFLPQGLHLIQFLQTFLVPFAVIAAANVKAITNRIARYGDLTYGTYIFSFPVQQMLIAEKITGEPLYLFLITLSVVIPLAFLSWHLLEKKMLLLKEKVS